MENEVNAKSGTKRTRNKKGGKNTIHVKVSRFQNLLTILKDWKKVLTLSFAIAAIGIILFCGITLIVLSIKRLYPYNDITINAMGTTTLRSENKDVSYFLLNSSELWASSGIKVKKGQTITIKSSGKKHSAIHHLVRDAESNSPTLRDPWVGAEGFPLEFDTRKKRDGERAKHRIIPYANQDILLLQIVADDASILYRPITGEEKTNRFIVVGNKMEDIHIDFNGTLYFAVNDVVLDDETIINMIQECDPEANTSKKYDIKELDKAIRFPYEKDLREYRTCQNGSIKANNLSKHIDTLYYDNYGLFLDSIGVSGSWDGRDTALFKRDTTNQYFINGWGPCEFGSDPTGKYIELYGYYMHKYVNAWYEDNVGSFLILIETVNE